MDGDDSRFGATMIVAGKPERLKAEGKLFVDVGPQLDRYKRVSGVLHDGRMGKRITLHPGAIRAPWPGKLDPSNRFAALASSSATL